MLSNSKSSRIKNNTESAFKTPSSNTKEGDLVNVQDLHLLAKIGKGAFGEVLRGTWLGTTVAIKRIKVKRMKLA